MGLKFHVIFIPKRRRRTLYRELRRQLGEVFRRLAAQKESEIVEGHRMRYTISKARAWASSSSRKFGWAMAMSSRARCRAVLPRNWATPYSVTT